MNAQEVITLRLASKKLFYDNIQPRLQTYHFGGRKKPHFYKESEVLAMRSGKPLAQRNPIIISGIFDDWTIYLNSLGYGAETVNFAIEIVSLPDEVITSFRLQGNLPGDHAGRFQTAFQFAPGLPTIHWSLFKRRS